MITVRIIVMPSKILNYYAWKTWWSAFGSVFELLYLYKKLFMCKPIIPLVFIQPTECGFINLRPIQMGFVSLVKVGDLHITSSSHWCQWSMIYWSHLTPFPVSKPQFLRQTAMSLCVSPLHLQECTVQMLWQTIKTQSGTKPLLSRSTEVSRWKHQIVKMLRLRYRLLSDKDITCTECSVLAVESVLLESIPTHALITFMVEVLFFYFFIPEALSNRNYFLVSSPMIFGGSVNCLTPQKRDIGL